MKSVHRINLPAGLKFFFSVTFLNKLKIALIRKLAMVVGQELWFHGQTAIVTLYNNTFN